MPSDLTRVPGHRHGPDHDHGLPRDLAMLDAVDIYDTTLRDGSQQEGLSLTVDDKLRVAEQLDHLGVTFIEGGWPGANPKDEEFFKRAPTELRLARSTLVAFGSTRRPGGNVETDETLRQLVNAGTSSVCIVAKAWDYHVTEALRTDLDEAVRMAGESVEFLCRADLRVFFDAEHFFDGYKRNPEFTMRVLRAAEESGAEGLVLCDTNGGTLPHEVEQILREVIPATHADIGVHFHNDGGCGVANALVAVRLGAKQVQGCINGYGERTGNADLCAAIPNLTLKMGVETIPRERIELITPVSNHIAELVNVTPDPRRPYVGTSSFTHKAGLHTSALVRARDAYEHIDPQSVGNGTRVVVSELAGRSTLQMKASELGLDLDGAALTTVLDQLKDLEHRGYHFEVADGSLELLMRGAGGWRQPFFELESFRVSSEHRVDGGFTTEATVKLVVDGERVIRTAEGNGPVNALDSALREAIGSKYPALDAVHLTDFKVRVLDTDKGTAAVTRVLLDSTDGEETWSTIGVSQNVIEASWQALADSVVYGLLHHDMDRQSTEETDDGGT